MDFTIRIGPGELLDRISILEIKAQRLSDEGAQGRVNAELARCRDAIAHLDLAPAITTLCDELGNVNRALWDAEEGVRACDRTKDFGDAFVEQARSIHRLNDRRSAIKRQIDGLLGSSTTEDKSYVP